VRTELSLVLPVYNQADHIVDVVERMAAVFRGRPWEIILVPNACHDESPQLCRRLARRHRGVRSIENPLGGWGLSVRVGLQAARGRFIGYTNSARTDPATVPELFNLIRKCPEVLAKVRRTHRGHPLREFGSTLYNLECRLLFGTRSGDVNGTPKIFSKESYRRMHLTSDGDLLDAEVLAWCRRLGIPLLEMPLAGWGRHGGKSTTSFRSAARMYLGVLKLKQGMR
jgi:hypothetical protein